MGWQWYIFIPSHISLYSKLYLSPHNLAKLLKLCNRLRICYPYTCFTNHIFLFKLLRLLLHQWRYPINMLRCGCTVPPPLPFNTQSYNKDDILIVTALLVPAICLFLDISYKKQEHLSHARIIHDNYYGIIEKHIYHKI
jgi:hypothetical protein